jgi:hypothetical protein
MSPALSPQEKLYQAYVDLGPRRSHAKLQEMVSENPGAYGLSSPLSLRTIRDLSSQGRWSQRIHDPASLERENAEKKYLERIEEHLERLRQRGLELQEVGIQLLRGVPANGVKVNDAVAAVETGLRLEAFSFISSADNPKQLALDEQKLSLLTDGEHKRLIELLQKAVGDAPEKPYKWKPTRYPWERGFDALLERRGRAASSRNFIR